MRDINEQIRKLSKTMKGIKIITAKQLKSDRLPNYQAPQFEGPIVVDYVNLVTK